jgi:hypothetical protein
MNLPCAWAAIAPVLSGASDLGASYDLEASEVGEAGCSICSRRAAAAARASGLGV